MGAVLAAQFPPLVKNVFYAKSEVSVSSPPSFLAVFFSGRRRNRVGCDQPHVERAGFFRPHFSRALVPRR